jgi:hypothetical protein
MRPSGGVIGGAHGLAAETLPENFRAHKVFWWRGVCVSAQTSAFHLVVSTRYSVLFVFRRYNWDVARLRKVGASAYPAVT